jgi:hypothetical protein
MPFFIFWGINTVCKLFNSNIENLILQAHSLIY